MMKENQMSDSTKRKKCIGIGLKIGCVMAAMQIFFVVMAVTICVYMFRDLITRMQEERCVNGTDMLAYELIKEPENEDINQILDEMKQRMGCEFTIFEGDTRKYSTVMQNGERVIGTKLSLELKNIVLEQGQSYVGEADILGVSYLCSYVPTKGVDGEITGLIFAGLPITDAKQGTANVISVISVTSLVTITSCVIFLAFYLMRRISKPLQEITCVAQRLERGDLGLKNKEEIRLSVQSNDEIGILGRIFEKTIQQMQIYIGEISDVLGAIADGDLTLPARQDYIGDFQSIRHSLDRIHTALNKTMGKIVVSTGQVSAGADQMASTAQSLAQGTTQQASAVEEVSATVTDISESARRTVVAAKEAGEFVNQVGSKLSVSMDYVKELNVAMTHISESSEKISTIISTIESIAFQINILALNAAVEAARAGTAGKGFAVVAEEVRNLAGKSDEAAKATKELIERSIVTVDEGSQAMNKVTQALQQTNQIADSVTTKMATVMEAVEQQTMAITQVNVGIEQISAVVQSNSAMGEECAAVSEELSSQASLLRSLMDTFQLK
ncbi:MAG: methyl-accepting chemotaxis protein [Lachnospiraceae bacterium]|jgi:methyl-accepting chemotaxis protein|nr:methyl-accepting chemotaxis protein [Lachnospiraceae bacterium]